jgi:hypothetical protein
MKMTVLRQMTAVGMVLAAFAPAMAGIQAANEIWRAAAGLDTGQPAAEATPPAAETAKPAAADAPLNDADKKKKTVPKPVAPAALTPEQATHKAADPKAPTGALIVKPPEDLPAPAAGTPAPPAAPPAK